MSRRNNGNGNDNDENKNDGGWSWWQTAAAAAGAVAVVEGLGYLLTEESSTSRASQASSRTDEQEQRGFLASLAESLQDVTGNSNRVNMERRNNGNGNENDGGLSWWQTAAATAAAAAGTMAVVEGQGYLLTKESSTSRASQASSRTDEQEQRGFLASLAESLQDVTGDSNRVNMERRNNGNVNWSWWQTAAAAAGTVAVVEGLGYLLTEESSTSRASQASSQTDEEEQRDSLQDVDNYNRVNVQCVISQHDVPSRPVISNLNSLLADIHVRYIALKKEDFQRHYRVFNEVFRKLHENMKAVDKYYERYASNVQFAGSHYDHLRINKPDEFDMDIVIGVPVNIHKDPNNPDKSDIVIEQKWPGFVQLRAGKQYQKILVRDGQDCLINRTAHEWLDNKKYILNSKFTDWFKSVGNRGLNQFPTASGNGRPVCYVDNVAYTIRTTSSGPAWTIIIESDGFRLDVDLVPALKFPENRWLGGAYRKIPQGCSREYWMVVPKPNKAGQSPHDEQRSWRLALQDQEKQLLNNTYNLRQTIRLLKKLRDAQGMKGIASYYIKTLFFWEVLEKKNIDPTFWQRSDIATLFKHMLQKFYEALEKQNIPYFWNKNNNMIENLNTNLVNEYKRKLKGLLNILQNPCDYKLVARYLLTSEEYNEYQHFL